MALEKYTVKNNATGRAFEVRRWGKVNLDMVWKGISCFFVPGSKVTIESRHGDSKVFIK